ncbi:NADH dehydrogenase [ubiquinone] 1 beta subcomplex subunit 5, mitochondrial-like [Chrysoperla carnea]|uniref:NADH dehydrogenase [ubiquinone] 1 beta subcomplex subunit 5, mitochondrial-like n=1 Tax=Chrysoperla carnea TaxID=189513 RepID=UPI001D076807|nr:NADH dehydrogenase [ubiquinone] 1 beta subcomplex subunit 5, mitochondrial-like [Chrysoperla carnea]
MSVISCLFRQIITKNPQIINNGLKSSKNAIAVRQMSDHGPRLFVITPSRWQWIKFKDLFHYYILVGAIPVLGVVTYANVFIGPAQLTEIPADYTPKHWEYHKHPITRFLARYVFPNPQQEYEKLMHLLYEEHETALIRKLEKDVRAKMAERNDYQAYYYRPGIAKYHRASREAADYLKSIRGD